MDAPQPAGVVRQVPPDSARLRFREMSAADLPFIAEMMADPEVMRFYPKRLTREEALAWIARIEARYARDGHALWLVEERATGAPVGQVGLLIQQVAGQPCTEIGYLVHRPFWRRGFALEAATQARAHAFGALDRPRVISLIRPENAPSIAVARKLGMNPGPHWIHGGFDHIVFSSDR